MARVCWWYYIAKFTEFLDTLFFLMRKKFQHVSTLHVIHHGCMPFSVWMGMKFAPGKLYSQLKTQHNIPQLYYLSAKTDLDIMKSCFDLAIETKDEMKKKIFLNKKFTQYYVVVVVAQLSLFLAMCERLHHTHTKACLFLKVAIKK